MTTPKQTPTVSTLFCQTHIFAFASFQDWQHLRGLSRSWLRASQCWCSRTHLPWSCLAPVLISCFQPRHVRLKGTWRQVEIAIRQTRRILQKVVSERKEMWRNQQIEKSNKMRRTKNKIRTHMNSVVQLKRVLMQFKPHRDIRASLEDFEFHALIEKGQVKETSQSHWPLSTKFNLSKGFPWNVKVAVDWETFDLSLGTSGPSAKRPDLVAGIFRRHSHCVV